MKQMFKVGDKVKVKPFFLIQAEAEYVKEEEAGSLYYFDRGRTPFNENMKEFCEKEFIITKIESRMNGDIYYGLDGLGRWIITEDMVMSEESTREEFEEMIAKLGKMMEKVREEAQSKMNSLNHAKEFIVDCMESNRKKVDFIDTIKFGNRVRAKWSTVSRSSEYIFCVGTRSGEVLFINLNNGNRLTSYCTREDLKDRLIDLLEIGDLEFIELIEE